MHACCPARPEVSLNSCTQSSAVARAAPVTALHALTSAAADCNVYIEKDRMQVAKSRKNCYLTPGLGTQVLVTLVEKPFGE